MQWNNSETAPTDGTAIRGLFGDNLTEYTVRFDGTHWRSIGSNELRLDLQAWLPTKTKGGLDLVSMRDSGITSRW